MQSQYTRPNIILTHYLGMLSSNKSKSEVKSSEWYSGALNTQKSPSEHISSTFGLWSHPFYFLVILVH